MTVTARQNNLILNEDWTRIYQTFKNADFKSYDFENLRRVIITYLRENYPEDFNDYIESSEYMALIDAVAFLGQSLSFRIDLASRENFIELAERKDSVLRIARMLSYNSKRNISAQGLLKFDTVSTTEDLVDSNGKNLSQQTIIWNDTTNPNWQEQFILVLNAAMADNTEFGKSQGSATIQGVPSDQYRLRTTSQDVPIFSFTKNVSGRRMAFELVSTSFKNKEVFYEEDPYPGNQLGFVYRQDGRGAASPNTGFFLMFKQGSLELADFNIDVPTSNEVVAINTEGVNNDDIWLFSLSSGGVQLDKWTKVSDITGNNIAYNSIVNSVRNIYAVASKEDDRVELQFADGVYGTLPQGSFRTYYRISNGIVYQIAPTDMRGINISIPYANKQGVAHTLTISMSLKYTVSNSSASESVESIRANAPAQYYTQNRMITGEDYNLAPLANSQEIIKVKAINRTSSGISRNFDIIDASGKYSNVNVFADDGFIYKNETEESLAFKFNNRVEIINYIRRTIEPLFTTDNFYNFYLTKFNKILFTDANTRWNSVTQDINQSTGYFINSIDGTLQKVSSYTTNNLRYLSVGALIKFVPPEGKAFRRGKLVDIDPTDPEQLTRIWTKIIKIVGDGTNAGRGVLTNGLGAVVFNDIVPSNAVAAQIVPRFVNNLPTALESEMVNLMSQGINFGLRYDFVESVWRIITSGNLNLTNNFSLGKTGDTTNTNLDSSWVLAFTKKADEYIIRCRGLDYVFGSVNQNRFYFDRNDKTYDSKTNKVIKDQVSILSINTDSGRLFPLKVDINFEVSDTIRFDDGYQSTNEIKIAFADRDDDGVVDDPDAFQAVVGADSELSYIFFVENVNSFGQKSFTYFDNSLNSILIYEKESAINLNNFVNGQLIYFYSVDEEVVKKVNRVTNTLEIQPQYRANIGRSKLKFQYTHNANVDRRIDPSVSNIIDVYLLTRAYDVAYRNFLIGASSVRPEKPTSDQLRISFGSKLDPIKSISDEIIYHPVEYKVLFGATADEKLRAVFKVVKNSNRSINDNDLKVRIVLAINSFFEVSNWDFGDKFYLGELITYITNSVAPDVSNIIIVPRQVSQTFGSLFEIQSRSDEIFVSGATVDDIEIVTAITASEIRADLNSVINSTN